MKQQTFKSVDDILRHYGWGGEVNLVEVKKDEGKADRTRDVPGPCEDSKIEREPDDNIAECVPEELRKGS